MSFKNQTGLAAETLQWRKSEDFAARFNREVLKRKGWPGGWPTVPESLRAGMRADIEQMVYDNMPLYNSGLTPELAGEAILNKHWRAQFTSALG
jgi:hypothetical protein